MPAIDAYLTSIGRRKYKARLPEISVKRKVIRRGRIIRGELQMCRDCAFAEGIRTLFRKKWQNINEKYVHNSGCISKERF